MAMQVQITQMEASGQQLYITFNAVASGNYSTGGDIIDFTKAVTQASNFNALWSGAVEASLAPVNLSVWSAGGNLARDYVAVQAGIATSKIKMNTTKGSTTELAAGAYPGDVTADTIQGSVTFNKLL